MKKNLFILFLLFLCSCNAEKLQTIGETCPDVFFSKEHKIYITSDENPLNIENISYRAELNNYFFKEGCSVLNNDLTGNLSLLFIINPENSSRGNILLPYYIAVLSSEDEIMDIQYYIIQGVIQKDPETSEYIETELKDTVNISIPNKDLKNNLKTNIVIGFMLDQEKIKILY